jgi:signal transduction histidine kinase
MDSDVVEKTPYRILLVEDDKVDQAAFQRLVRDDKLPYSYVIVETIAAAREVLQRERFDVVIMDYRLADGTALDVLDSTMDSPVVITTGAGDETIAVRAMKAGSRDYLVKDHDGHYLQVLPRTIENVIKQKRAEDKLKEYDRLKDGLIVTVSHELRTPLTIFKNIISNALAGVMGKISPKLRENLEIADRNIDRLGRIISDFLDISKIESGRMQLQLTEFNMKSLIREVVTVLEPLAAEKRIKVNTSMPLREVLIKADYDRIAQVLTNLVGNAIKFVPEKGRINLRLTDEDERITVEVQDDGPGIAEADKTRVFERFVQIIKQTGPGGHGTGLGLSISKKLVGMHGGCIWVESELGKGSSFFFTLPRRDRELKQGTFGPEVGQSTEEVSGVNQFLLRPSSNGQQSGEAPK